MTLSFKTLQRYKPIRNKACQSNVTSCSSFSQHHLSRHITRDIFHDNHRKTVAEFKRIWSHFTQTHICKPISLIITEHGLAGRSGPRTGRIAQYFLPELGLLSQMWKCPLCCVSRVSAWHRARATTGSHSHLHPLCALTHASRPPPHAHAR